MKVAIIGGGITGLTTGIAMQKQGLEATIYEKAPNLNEIGAGVWLQPNAMRVFDLMGLKEDFLQAGQVLDRMDITNAQLEPFRKVQSETVTDNYGNQTVAIHRAKLQEILFEKFSENGTVHLGHEFRSYQKMGNTYQIEFQNDAKIETDVILACDGIHSRVRAQLFPDSSLRDSKQICWRGIANYRMPQELQRYGRESWGPKIRFGFSEIQEDLVYWFAVANSNKETDNLRLQDLPTLFQDFHPIVLDLIRATESAHIGPIKDLNRLSKWSEDRICLMGDAAHATTPNMGQGACQGIEDAYYMAYFLKKFAPKEAFDKFEKQRRSKVDYVVKNSWRFGKAAHSSSGQKAMKLMFRFTPESMIQKQMKDLYALEEIV